MAKYKAYNYDQLVMIPISLEDQSERLQLHGPAD
jgi:hypothetical protein